MTKKNRFMQGVVDTALVKNKTFFIESNQSFPFKIDRYSKIEIMYIFNKNTKLYLWS